MAITTCIFNAYGTLFDIAAAAREAAAQPEFTAISGQWQKLAADWRQKQLEYSWLRAITGEYRDFWRVTSDALDWALRAQSLEGDDDLRDRLLSLYGMNTAILSNGTPEMLDAAVQSAGLDDVLDDVLSVESVGTYKPAQQVYALVPERFRCAPEEVLYVSSDAWDASGAASHGFINVWVNRTGLPRDRLGHPPHEILEDLVMLPEITVALR